MNELYHRSSPNEKVMTIMACESKGFDSGARNFLVNVSLEESRPIMKDIAL